MLSGTRRGHDSEAIYITFLPISFSMSVHTFTETNNRGTMDAIAVHGLAATKDKGSYSPWGLRRKRHEIRSFRSILIEVLNAFPTGKKCGN